MIQKLLEYEKKILQYRSELNELIQSQNSTDNKPRLIETKIDYLKQELAYIDDQLNILKASTRVSDVLAKNQIHTADASNNITSQNVISNSNVSPQKSASTANMSNMTGTYYSGTATQAPNNSTGAYYNGSTNATPIKNTKQEKSPKDFENLMGKNLMGIFASVLIFISFIVFATVVLPNLSDEIKMIAMYLVSFAFLGLGLYLLKKDNRNKLYLSISGCGIGAIYISVLVSNVYFNAISDIPMYLLIFIWALFVCYLSRSKSWIFQIIGQIGITIAILFGAILCSETSDWTKLLFLIIFFIASQTMFFVAHYDDEYQDNIINIVGQLVCLFILYNTVPGYYHSDEQIVIITLSYVLLMLFALAHITLGLFKFKISKKSRMPLVITNICYFALFSSLFEFDGRPLYLLGFALLTLIAIEWRFEDNKFNELRIMQGYYMFTLIVRMYQLTTVDSLEFIMYYVSFAVLTIPFAIYGFITKDKLYKFASMVFLTLFIFDFGMNDTAQTILGAGLIAMFCYLLKQKEYNTKIKTFLYGATMFFVLFNAFPIVDSLELSGEASFFAIFAIISLSHMIAVKSPFGKNWVDKSMETSFGAVSGIVNAMLMFVSLIYIALLSNTALHFMSILIALMLFMINSKRLLQRERMAWGIYVGIKFTIYMIVILDSFTAPDFAISICCLLFAIASIVIGFMLKYKSLRLYGLGLSLLSIVKLIIIDMNYENTISRAFSFFICGILCFIISSIYNYVNKKISQ